VAQHAAKNLSPLRPRQGIVKLRWDHREWQKGGMNDSRSTLRYPGFRFPAEIIGHAVWLYHRFTLSSAILKIFWLNAGLS
jgi:hypothetical protein